MTLEMDAALATIISSIAIVASAIFVVVQLRQAARDRYVTITSDLFEIWQSSEFQEDQLYLLHKFVAPSWDDFVALGRGERAERALYRVGGYYDRIGSLVRHGLIRQDDILPAVGGTAIAVWARIEPLVQEARRRENAFLFHYFEAVLPNCRECWVPNISASDLQVAASHDDIVTTPAAARRLLEQGRAIMLDVSRVAEPTRIAGARRPQPNDLSGWLAAIEPGKDVLTYCT
jgi:hypothetical protein